MIAYHATDKLKALYPKVKSFVEKELLPKEGEFMKLPYKEVEKKLRGMQDKVKATGAWNLYHEETHGGPGLTLMEQAQIAELLGRTPLGHLAFNCQAPDAGNMELLLKYASDEAKEKYLYPLLEGKIRSCFSMTEPEYAGSNPVMMGTTARREGDEYVINGHKWFTSSADGASFAIVMAQTDPDNPHPYRRASMIIVPTNNPGFKFIRNIPIMGEAGEGHASHAEIRYEDCRVPVSNLIGPEGAGFILAQERLGPGRIHHCMRWIGICERSFDMLCTRAATRNMGRGKMLGEKQMVQDWIAESRASIDAARLMVLNAAYKMQHEGQKEASQEISTIKFYVANVLTEVVDRAIQAHGALGITDDTILSWFYRHERGARIYDGPDEAHKASLARKILKQYGLVVQRKPEGDKRPI